MKCPLCETRKAKRLCPAKGTHICPVCCGTKREVEIDCPSDCVYLHSGREYESERMARAATVPPLTPRLWENAFLRRHEPILVSMWQVITAERVRLPEMVDADVQAALDGLIRTFETLERGIYYDSPPSSVVQRSLFLALQQLLDDPRKEFEVTGGKLKTSTILDCLRLQKEVVMVNTSPRPKSRAFLDHIRTLVGPAAAGDSSLIIAPSSILSEG